MDDGLRGEDLSDRSSDGRLSGLLADDGELIEDVVEPIVAPCARRRVSIAATRPAGSSCCAARTAMCGASGVTGSSPMNSSTISAACQSVLMSTPLSSPGPVESAGEPLAGDAVERERDRVDGARDEVRPGAGGVEGRSEPAPGSPWQKMPTGSPLLCGERRDELVAPDAASSAPDGSWSRTRAAPSSGSFFACSTICFVCRRGRGCR